MRFARVAALTLSLSVLIVSRQPTTTSAAGDRSISGSVFFDTNKNGQFDFGEVPAPGRTVQLSRFDRAERRVAQVKSDAQGYYRFDHIPSHFSVINVGVWTDEQTGCITGDTVGVDNQNGGMLRGKTVTPGTTVNLGVLPMGNGSVTGTFSNDLNRNGIHDADEPPLKGWKITLSGLEMPNVYCYSEATTGSDGAFHIPVSVDTWNFLSVSAPPSVRDPWEWTAPTQRSGNGGSAPDQRDRPDFVPEGKQLDVMIHFSTGNAQLSGTVFRDLDGDGAHDPTEPFLDCHHTERFLQLSREFAGVGAIEVETTATCATDGKFKFSRLESGDYRIAIPAYFQLPEYYHPWTGQWVSIADGEHVKDYVIALCPADKCPEPSPTAIPTRVRPVEKRPTDAPLVMPPAGIESSESNYVRVALLLAVTGLASMFTAALLHAHRPRRN